MSVSLIIPAYNEEDRLGQFLADVAIYVSGHPDHLEEVLIIDDGSQDKTIEVANKFKNGIPQLRVVEHEKNKGKGAAIKTGVEVASASMIVFMDADGATPIDEMPKMIESLSNGDVAVGNRWMKNSVRDDSSPLRHLAGIVYKNYMGLFGLKDVDTMCGFKGYRREVARDLFKDLIEERWLFDTEIAYKARRKGYKIINFPISWHSVDGSKLPTSTLIKSAFEIWPLIRKIKEQSDA